MFKERLSKAGMSAASFARKARINPRTVYRWEDGPDWAYAFVDALVELEDLRRRVHVLERLSHTLIDGETPLQRSEPRRVA